MPDLKNIVLVIMTPFGPTTLFLTVEAFANFVKELNIIFDNIKGETPIPKAFEDAFNKEE